MLNKSILVISCLLSLVGCGDSSSKDDNKTPADYGVGSSGGDIKIEAFEKENAQAFAIYNNNRGAIESSWHNRGSEYNNGNYRRPEPQRPLWMEMLEWWLRQQERNNGGRHGDHDYGRGHHGRIPPINYPAPCPQPPRNDPRSTDTAACHCTNVYSGARWAGVCRVIDLYIVFPGGNQCFPDNRHY